MTFTILMGIVYLLEKAAYGELKNALFCLKTDFGGGEHSPEVEL